MCRRASPPLSNGNRTLKRTHRAWPRCGRSTGARRCSRRWRRRSGRRSTGRTFRIMVSASRCCATRSVSSSRLFSNLSGRGTSRFPAADLVANPATTSPKPSWRRWSWPRTRSIRLHAGQASSAVRPGCSSAGPAMTRSSCLSRRRTSTARSAPSKALVLLGLQRTSTAPFVSSTPCSPGPRPPRTTSTAVVPTRAEELAYSDRRIPESWGHPS
mmetsp:Transcript_17093/g.60801  ORF Transcript_17093/g.60801 Transcript_17093/m.60801 type:complete len:214 (-) Transcript_17093:135-776(-)